jgi:ABC-2 type transport system permease protein
MHSLAASIRNETLKIVLKKKTVFFLAMTILIPIGASLLVANLQSSIGIGTIASKDFPIVMLGLFTSIFLPLFVFMGAADQFSGELGDRTLKVVLTRPVSRFKVFASKQISLGLSIAAYLAAAFVASAASSLLLEGTGGLGAAFTAWIPAYGAAFLPLATLSIVAVLLAQLFTSSSGALTTSILLYIAAKVAAFFFPQVFTYSPTAYMDWHMMWLGSPMATDQIFSVFMFLLACSILCFTAGYYFFDKKEL